MHARETHAGGSFLARERGAFLEPEQAIQLSNTPTAQHMAPLITFLTSESLLAIAHLTGRSIEDLFSAAL